MSWDALLGGLGGAFLLDAYKDIGNIGQDAQTAANQLAASQLEQTQFQPYTVTSATGGQFQAGPDGQYSLSLGGQGQAMQNQLFGQANQMFGQPVTGQAQLNQAGLGAVGAGLGLMNQPVFGTAPTQAASQQAFGMGNQFMQSAQQQPARLAPRPAYCAPSPAC